MKTMLGTTAAIAILLIATNCDTKISPSQVVESPAVQSSTHLTQASGLGLMEPGPTCVGARTPGFYCQNKDGKNPNMLGEFSDLEVIAAETLETLGPVEGLSDVGDAVCITGNRLPEDQLLRHMAALVLNLAANLISVDTPLRNPPPGLSTVGDALAEAISVANDPNATKQDRNAIKDVLDQINNNQNTILGDECVPGNEVPR